MEFPDLGEHCSEKTCKRLGEHHLKHCQSFGKRVGIKLSFIKINFYNVDFLPMRCDACQEIFCKDHITYANHKCTSAYKKASGHGWPWLTTQQSLFVSWLTSFFQHWLFSCRMCRSQFAHYVTPPSQLKEERCLTLQSVTTSIGTVSQTQHKERERYVNKIFSGILIKYINKVTVFLCFRFLQINVLKEGVSRKKWFEWHVTSVI